MEFFRLADKIAEVGYPDENGNRVYGEEAILLCIRARRIRYEDFYVSKGNNKPIPVWIKEAARCTHSYE